MTGRYEIQAMLRAATGVAVLLAVLALPAIQVATGGLDWTIEVVDGEGGAGRDPALALGPDRWPRISYSFSPSKELRYAWRDASGWHNETADQRVGPGNLGFGTSLALDQRSNAHISYIAWEASTDQFIWYAFRNATTLSWSKEVVAPSGASVISPGLTSMALNASGAPSILFINVETGALVYAYRSGSSWGFESIESPGFSAGYTISPASLRFDTRDRPHVVYYDSPNGTLRYAVREPSGWRVDVVDSGGYVGPSPSLVLDASDRPRIAYIDYVPNKELKYAAWTGSSWNITKVPGTIDVESPSIGLDSASRPRISYNRLNPQDLMFAHWTGGQWRVDLVDSDYVLFHTSLAVDANDVTHIAYYHRLDGLVGRLKYARGVTVNDLPTSSVQSVAPYWRTSGPLSLTASASDPDGSIVSVSLWYRHDGGGGWGAWTNFGTDTSPPWQWSFPFPDGQGRYEFYSQAFDGQDSEGIKPVAEASAGFDGTPPSSVVSPLPRYWHDVPSTTVQATAMDSLSGVAQVSLRYSHSPDNATWGSWTTFAILTTPPWSWTFLFPDGEGHYRFHSVSQDISGNGEGSKGAAEALAGYRVPPDYLPALPSPSSPAAVGLFVQVTFSIETRNLGGNANATATVAFYNASSPGSPFATLPLAAIPAGGAAGPFSATWTSPSTAGTYAVSVSVDHLDDVAETDESNNVYTWILNVVEGPVTTLIIGQPSYTAGVTYVTSSTPFSFVVVDQGGTGIRQTSYRIDAGAWTLYTGPFTVAGEGEHLLEWFSEDFVGNLESVQPAAVRVDDTPPTVSLLIGDPKYLQGGTFVTSSTLLEVQSVDGGIMPAGVASVEFRVDGGPWASYATPFSMTGEGSHVVESRSSDFLGNGASFSWTIVVDDSPPDVSVQVGEPSIQKVAVWVGPGTTFDVVASDRGPVPVGLSLREYRIGAGAWTPYAGPFALSPPDGLERVEYRASDHLGNAASGAMNVVLDAMPPETAHAPLSGPFTPDTRFNLTSADDGIGVARTEYRVDGGPWLLYTEPFSLPPGQHLVGYRSVDRLNNTEAERTFSAFVEAPPVPEKNWKPAVAASFAAVLAVLGFVSSRRGPWKGELAPSARRRALATTSLPFVALEAATGIFSFLTGQLAIPPLLGVGTAVDVAVLVAGGSVAVYRTRKWTP